LPDKSYLFQTSGNTPLKIIPKDYYPKGNGYWFEIPQGLDRGKKLFFRDSIHGNNSPTKTIVFVHGNPECSYTYRKIINHLVMSSEKSFRIISPDHIGFGLSDQADYEMVSKDHARNLLFLIKYLNLKDVILVIHDWGGPIGIGAFLREAYRVNGILILNSTVFPISNKELNYNNYPIPWLGWSKTPFIIPNRFWGSFASYAIFSKPNKPIKLLLGMVKYILLFEFTNKIYENHIARQVFKKQFSNKMNTKSSKRLVKQSAHWGQGNSYYDPKYGIRHTRGFYNYLQKNLIKFWGPNGQNIKTHAFFGRWDPLGQNYVIKQWIKNLPQLKGNIEISMDSGHFVEEIKYRDIAKLLLRMI
jgi:pimeloyl-ACP methyl ester carboxylesterase